MSQNCEFKTFLELLSFHDSHSDSFHEEATKLISELQSANDGLKALVNRWASVKSSGAENIDWQAKNEGVDGIAIVRGKVSPFIESDELERLARLKTSLKVITGEILEKMYWLQTVNSTMRQARMGVHNIMATGEVSDETFVMLWDAGASYVQFQMATNSLRKALDVIESIDFSQKILQSDLVGPKFIPKLLKLASEFVDQATSTSLEAMNHVKFSPKVQVRNTKDAKQLEERKKQRHKRHLFRT